MAENNQGVSTLDVTAELHRLREAIDTLTRLREVFAAMESEAEQRRACQFLASKFAVDFDVFLNRT